MTMAFMMPRMVLTAAIPIPLPKEVKEKLDEWESNSKSVSVMITGKTGSGKSTLVNTLVGQEVAVEGRSLSRCSTEVASHSKKVEDVDLKVWDSPGLQDETEGEAKYLQEIKRNCNDVDLFVYCIRMSERNYLTDIVAMKKLTDTLGQDIWENAIIVLTFANDISEEAIAKHGDEQKKIQKDFMKSLKKWRKEIKGKLQEVVGLPKEQAERVDVLPAGYRTDPKLPIKESPFWLTKLWLRALLATKSRAQPAMIKINRHRFKTLEDEGSEEAKDDATQKEMEKGQDLIFENKGMEFGEEFDIDPELSKICGTCKSHGKGGAALMIELGVLSNMFSPAMLGLFSLLGGAQRDGKDSKDNNSTGDSKG